MSEEKVQVKIVLTKPLETPKKPRGRPRKMTPEERVVKQRELSRRYAYKKKYGDNWETMWNLNNIRNKMMNACK